MSLNETNYKDDLIKFEVDIDLSRKNVTVVAAAALARGTVLGIKTADSKYYPSVAGASDGTENAVAILLDPLAITTGKVVPVLRRLAVIDTNYLVWDSSYDTDNEKNAAIAYLEANCTIVGKASL